MNQNDFYKLKYSKYKSKYLELKQKNLEGGTKPKSGYYVFFINKNVFSRQDYKIHESTYKDFDRQNKYKEKSFVKKIKDNESIPLRSQITGIPPTRNVKYDELCKISLLVIPCDDKGELKPPSDWIFPDIDKTTKEGWKHVGCNKLNDIKITSMDLKKNFIEASGCIKQTISNNILWVGVSVSTYIPNKLIDSGEFKFTNEEKCKFLELKQ